jgi:hypothetical protein
VCSSNAAPHSTLLIIECGVERVQLAEPSTNERVPLLLLLVAVAHHFSKTSFFVSINEPACKL